MGWLDSVTTALRGAFSAAGDFIDGHFNEFNNGDFKNGAMAFAAQLTMADGEKHPDEVKKMAGMIDKHEMLQKFNSAELRKLYTDYCNDFDFDFDFASENIRSTLMRVTDREQQRGIIIMGIILGKADGDFDEDERRVVQNLIDMYGHSASEYTSFGL